MNEKEVQNHLVMWLQPSLLIVPNVQLGPGQADLIRYSSRRKIEEYEIKLSRSDFFRDKSHKKHKHGIMTGKYPGEIANRFFYAYPKGMIKIEEIPEYAGAVEFEESRDKFGDMHLRFDLVKKAPLLHSRKCDLKRLAYFMRGLSLRYWEKRRYRKELE